MEARSALRWVTCLALGLAACQPLYGGKPEKLVNAKHGHRPEAGPEVAAPVVYVEDCQASFNGDPAKVNRQSSLSRSLVDTGDTALASGDKAKDDNAKVGLYKEAIDKYRNALIKDPYNVEATLKLAVAYDKTLRKGCAIAMLKRLASFSNNQKFSSEANRNIDAIDTNASWFKGYRKDAMAAVGR